MDPAKRLMIFATAYVRRSQDQRAAIAFLNDFARGRDPLAARIDAGNIAVIGYSMGGYGALATGGAGHDPKAPVMAQLPPGAMTPVLEGVKPVPGVRALVLIAPWGGQPQVRAFTPSSLAGITMPSLWIMGDKDDVAGADGIRWLHDQAVASDRRLLVFADARHNLGGNPPPASAPDTGRLRDALDEPVWRKDMADAVIFRELTAFCDLVLKGDAAKAAWLDVDATGALKGFQNRWQLGLAATHTPAH
jgi:pimeloyl-ACP methyl ester carboxylesterase